MLLKNCILLHSFLFFRGNNDEINTQTDDFHRLFFLFRVCFPAGEITSSSSWNEIHPPNRRKNRNINKNISNIKFKKKKENIDYIDWRDTYYCIMPDIKEVSSVEDEKFD